ncbi:hypothetical protein [Moraxella ovis]|uniref:hypothetical protein n=1 Tax=Moraxella ovis TaxID=29433 RepID=UPI000DD83552|nr:hypothetical protein [Moraxella ovis]
MCQWQDSFDLGTVQSANTQAKTQTQQTPVAPKAPTYQDDKVERRTFDADASEPALGYVLTQIPKRVVRLRGEVKPDETVILTQPKSLPSTILLKNFLKFTKKK